MAYGTPADPVGGTVITVAYAVANILNPIRWLRLLTGNADPPGSNYVVVSDPTTGTTWRKIPTDAIADLAITTPKYALGSIGTAQIADLQITTPKIADANVTASKLAVGAAVSNIGYTPVNRAGDIALGAGGLGWSTTAYLVGVPNQLFLVSGQLIYLVDSATGLPVGTFDVVNKVFTWPGSAALTAGITASAATLTGALNAASATLTGALNAASAALTGNLTAAAARATKSGPTPSSTSYDSAHLVAITPGDNTAPMVGFSRVGVSGASLYESGNRLHVWGADNVHGEIPLKDGSGVIPATQFNSSATGATPPFVAASSAKVNNFHADVLDGAHATATPTGGFIPIADGAGHLDSWISASFGAPLIGEIRLYAAVLMTAPNAAGWRLCDGSAVSRTTYAALFGTIGAVYGNGDGSTTFNLPDFRGRFPMGVSGSHAIGASGGAETVDDRHPHTLSGTGVVLETGSGAGLDLDTTVNLNHAGTDQVAKKNHTHGNSAATSGGNAALAILNPYLTAEFIIYAGV